MFTNMYHLSRASIFADLSRQVYTKQFVETNVKWDEIKHCAVGSANILVARKDKDVVIAIAGSDDIYDWVYNSTLSKAYIGGIAVSKGVKDYSQIVQSGLQYLNAGSDILLTADNVWLTGHSLGGAAALLVPLLNLRETRFSVGALQDKRVQQLWEKLSWPKEIVTFGSPRILSDKASMLYPYQSVHFEASYDPVPYLPMWKGLHVPGKRVFLSGSVTKKQFKVNSAPTKTQTLVAHLLMFFSKFSIVRNAHASQRYCDLLAPYANELPWHLVLFPGS